MAAAAWDEVGRAGNLLQLLGVDAFGLASMITQAALTARRNRDACLQLAEHVHVVGALLRRLQVLLPRLRRRPETRRPLEQLDDALRRAYLLVRSCGEELEFRSYLYQLLTGARTAARLRAAEEEIDRFIRLIPMIGLVATVRVQGDQDVLELDDDDPTPPPSPRLSLDVDGSTTNLVLTPAGDFPLPGIEGFQIDGEPRTGCTLTACGFPINGTTTCYFQWVRCLDDGIRQDIEGARTPEYVVTADDVDTVLAVECTPKDANGLQGELVTTFANGENKIACDSNMQSEINACISNEEALYDVFVLKDNSLELATVTLRRTGYQIKIKCSDEVIIAEEFSQMLQTKIPIGCTTQFVLESPGSVNLTFNTSGITEPNNEDCDVRLRDLLVLVIRAFQKKALALDAEE